MWTSHRNEIVKYVTHLDSASLITLYVSWFCGSLVFKQQTNRCDGRFFGRSSTFYLFSFYGDLLLVYVTIVGAEEKE